MHGRQVVKRRCRPASAQIGRDRRRHDRQGGEATSHSVFSTSTGSQESPPSFELRRLSSGGLKSPSASSARAQVYIYIYIYIYIERERERDIYIYIYVCIYTVHGTRYAVCM